MKTKLITILFAVPPAIAAAETGVKTVAVKDCYITSMTPMKVAKGDDVIILSDRPRESPLAKGAPSPTLVAQRDALVEPNRYYVEWWGTHGMVAGDCLDLDSVRDKLDTLLAAQQREQERLQTERLAALRAKWGEEIAKDIVSEKISVGMTADMVREAWGKPKRINTTTTATGTREQWVYGVGQYVYFEGGKCTAIQQSK